MKITTKGHIISYLKSRDWVPGYELEAQATNWKAMASQITRRARDLQREGAIEKRYGKKHLVEYRWRSPIQVIPKQPIEQAMLFKPQRVNF